MGPDEIAENIRGLFAACRDAAEGIDRRITQDEGYVWAETLLLLEKSSREHVRVRDEPKRKGQRDAALRVANRRREERARVKQRLRSLEALTGRPKAMAAAASIVREPCEDTAGWVVVAFLVCVPGVGKVRARKWSSQLLMKDRLTLGELSDRQRKELVALLDPGVSDGGAVAGLLKGAIA